MKESVRITERIHASDRIDLLRAAAAHTSVALFGWIAAQALIKGGILPFGLAFLCGMPSLYLPAAAIGVFVGYFFPAISGGGFRYIAALFCILSVKVLLGGHKKLVENPFLLSLLCFFTQLLTAAVSLTAINLSAGAIITESLLASGGTFFVTKAAKALTEKQSGLLPEELTALLIAVNMLLIGLMRMSVFGVSAGRICGVLLILVCARYGGILSGAVSGISVSVANMLFAPGTSMNIAFALAGLLAGVLVPYGKYAQVGGLIGAVLIGILVSGKGVIWISVTETLIGTAIFLCLPRGVGTVCGRLFCAVPRILTQNGLRRAVSLRLELSAGALRDISQTVDRVAGELNRINTPDYGQMIAGIEKDACAGCKLHKLCWNSRKESTLSEILAVTKAVKTGENDLYAALTTAFRDRCLHTDTFVSAVSRHYTAYAAKIDKETRVDEVRSILSEQFESIAGLLTDLRFDLEREERFDHAMALSVSTALHNLDIRADECSCTVDRFGRMTVRIKVKRNKDVVLNKRQIMKAISLVCERDFDVPTFTETGGSIYINITERTVLNVQTGIAQSNAGNAALCGDTCRQFYDGTGHYYLLLSDGMGTGGRAAIDSAMTSGLMARLLRAGFGFDCALRVLNTAMLFKSSDESLATVDLACIDLFTGETRLYKAGAAGTVIRRGNRTGIAESHSLPIGILQNVGFDKMAVRLHTGDIILLLSDGAAAVGTEWIKRIADRWENGSAEDLAECVCKEAKKRQPVGHEDDITVMAAILRRNL